MAGLRLGQQPSRSFFYFPVFRPGLARFMEKENNNVLSARKHTPLSLPRHLVRNSFRPFQNLYDTRCSQRIGLSTR